MPPILSFNELLALGSLCKLKDAENVRVAASLMHDLGTLVYFEHDDTLQVSVLAYLVHMHMVLHAYTHYHFVRYTLCKLTDAENARVAASLMHNLGKCTHTHTHTHTINLFLISHQDLVILDPQWLVDVMACVLTTKHVYGKDGKLKYVHVLICRKYCGVRADTKVYGKD